MNQKVLKTGNSLAVTIPSDFVHNLGIKAGDKVKSIKQLDRGKISYVFSQTLQLPLSKEIIRAKKS